MSMVEQPLPGVVYPPADILDYYLREDALPRHGLIDALQASFAEHASRTALSMSGRLVSYEELDKQSDRLAAGLLSLGLRPLDRALFQSINSIELVVALIACFKAGLIPVCTLAAHREHEITYLGNHAEAKVHFVQADDGRFDLPGFALKMRESIGSMREIIVLQGDAPAGTYAMQALIDTVSAGQARMALQSLDRDPFQVAIFQLSGGTTGVPKIIPRMANDYLLNAQLTADWLGYTRDDVIFLPMQIIHNAGMMCMLLPGLLSGAELALPADLAPESWGEVFRERMPTWVCLIRALLPRFNAMVEQQLAGIESVRAFWAPDAARLIRLKYGIPAYAMFGMSEGMNMYIHQDDPAEVLDAGMVGRPLSPFDEIRLVEPGTVDKEVAAGEVGELTCRGPYTLRGYYKAEERNADAFTRDGFYRSGDLMVRTVIDGVSYYAFAGRTKDTVNRGMEKINCEEVEGLISTHPDVSDCAIVAMPDPVLGERACAFIVAKAGKPLVSVESLGNFLEQLGVAKFKWPERIEGIDALPLTKVGKLDKATMRQLIVDILARERGEDKNRGE